MNQELQQKYTETSYLLTKKEYELCANQCLDLLAKFPDQFIVSLKTKGKHLYLEVWNSVWALLLTIISKNENIIQLTEIKLENLEHLATLDLYNFIFVLSSFYNSFIDIDSQLIIALYIYIYIIFSLLVAEDKKEYKLGLKVCKSWLDCIDKELLNNIEGTNDVYIFVMQYYSTIFLANLQQFSLAFDAIENDTLIDNKIKMVYALIIF